jgi:hypothetical protein
MKYRAHQAGANYIFKTTPGKGVCIELRIRHTGQSNDKCYSFTP